MKKLLLILSASVLFISTAAGQVAPPRAFSYRATIVSKSGAIVASKTVSLRISILKNNADGIAVYSEVFYPITSEYGQVDLVIGKGFPQTGNFALIEWSDDEYFLRTEVDVKGGNNFLLMSVVQLMSVPYSLFSDKANHAYSAVETDPVFSEHPSANISDGDISNWNTAASWGNHADEGYAPGDSVYSRSDFRIEGRAVINWNNLSESPSKNISTDDISNWNTSSSWGDHALAGYAMADSVYTKSDLQSEGKSEVNWKNLNNKPEFATVATTGRYNDLLNLPEIPDNLNQLTPDAGNRTITNVARPVNAGDAATKAYVDALIERITTLEKAAGITHIERDSVKDFEGNTYKTVKIGDQWWMAENLRSTRYSNGEPVKRVSDNVVWSNPVTGSAYCFYNNDSASYYNTYGMLYNWYAVKDPRNICPAGWHIPSDGEWNSLSNYAGGDIISGGKLKEKDLVHWIIQNAGATDDFGFTGLPGGTRNPNGTYTGIGIMGHFWTITEVDAPTALFRRITNTSTSLNLSRTAKTLGTSVRCIKGESAPSAFAVVTTDSIFNITSAGATSGGNVVSDAGDKVIARGVTWSAAPNPIVAGAKTIDGADTGRFVSNIINIQPGRTYFVRAYATNRSGTAYGNEISFTANPGIPSINGFDVNLVTATSARSSAVISYDGGSPVTARGMCYSHEPDPTIDDSTTNEGPGSGAFESNLTGLQPATVYFIRAYATNSIGTSYGSPRSFRTLDPPPAVSTDSVIVKTATAAVVVGTFTGPMGAEYGVCWSVSPNPTTSENKIIYPGPGSYNCLIRFLEPGTTYFARLYALAGADIIYGEQVSFTTHPYSTPCPLIIRIENVRSETVSIQANFDDDGGYPLTMRGICWSISPEPDTSDSKMNYAGYPWYYITGLTPGTKYYVRGYAVNSLGIGYGLTATFTTNPDGVVSDTIYTGTITDIDNSHYNTVTIGTQTWLKENLKTTKYSNGDPIPNIIGSDWSTQNAGAYCLYNNDTVNKNIYGALYNWYAVADPRNICPSGWHEPTNGEWTTLIMHLGGETIAAGKLKEAGLSHWIAPNVAATNESGFTALPGGLRDPNSNFSSLGSIGNLWSSSECDAASAYILTLSNNTIFTSISRSSKSIGLAVRCIKGESAPVSLPEVITSPVTNITTSGAVSGGTVVNDGGETVVARGV